MSGIDYSQDATVMCGTSNVPWCDKRVGVMTLKVGVEEVRQECNGGHETMCNWEHEKSKEDGRSWEAWLLGLLQCTVCH